MSCQACSEVFVTMPRSRTVPVRGMVAGDIDGQPHREGTHLALAGPRAVPPGSRRRRAGGSRRGAGGSRPAGTAPACARACAAYDGSDAPRDCIYASRGTSLFLRVRPASPDERGPEPRRPGAAPDRAGDRRARCAVRGGRRGDRAGRRPGARRDAGAAPAGPRLHHLGPARGHRAAAQGLGRRDLGRRARVRHDRLPQGGVAGRDHDVPLGGLRPRRRASPRWPTATRSPTTWCAATSRSTRWR